MKRAEVSLRPPQALRDAADRVSRAAGDRREVRARYLERERVRLARAVLPLAGLIAAIFAGALVMEAGGARRAGALLPLASGALVGGGALLLARPLRRKVAALHVLAVATPVLAALCLAVAARRDDVHFAFALVVLTAGAFSLPLGPAASLALGAAFPVAIVIAGHHASPHLWLGAAPLVVFAVTWARARRRRVLAAFRRSEKLRIFLQRLRGHQEELVIAEKLEALRVLVGGIAHELNNALAVSQVSLDAAHKADPERARDLVEKARGGLGRIKRTIDRLRRFAMAADDELEPADVAAMLDFALESAIGRARSGVVVDRRYEGEIAAVSCHVSALAEALFQISKNAVESMPAGGTITARVKEEAGSVVLSVADEGKGIDEKDLARVFDPYFTREKAESVYTTLGGGRARGGGGMGLSAAYGLVRALGGTVKIKSEPGQGTEVAIFLPRKV